MCQAASPQFLKKHPLNNAGTKNTCTAISLSSRERQRFKGKGIGVFGKHLKVCTEAQQCQTIKLATDTVTEPKCQVSGRMPSDMQTPIL